MQIQVELQDSMGSDRSIAEAAWTSSLDYQKKQKRNDADVKRVVEMLANLKHSVPFESVVLRFWIKMPIATDRQLMTHRIASHSGMSGRYRTMPTEWLAVPDDVDDILTKVDHQLSMDYNKICLEANQWYKSAVDTLRAAELEGTITNAELKRAREFVRGVLPQHNMTERVTIMNLRSFANFMKLRLKPDAQPEIREVAELMLQQVKASNVCPIAIEWLEKNDWDI